jgi:acyl-CoA thioesterase FadM
MVTESRIRMNPGATDRTRMEDAEAQGLVWLVLRQDVDYLSRVDLLVGTVRVRTCYAKVGNTSLTLVAQVEHPETHEVFARTTTVLVCADADGKPTAVPPGIAKGLELWPAVGSSR